MLLFSMFFTHFPLRILFFCLLIWPSAISRAQYGISGTATDKEFTARRSADTFSRVIAARLDSLTHDTLLQHSQLGLLVYDLTTDTTLFSHGEKQRLRPASTIKVLTAITALDQLGGDYRFTTQLCAEGTTEDSLLRGNLTIKGGFDPLFGKDDLRAMIQELHTRGIRMIGGDIILDVSMKDTARMGWGWCWDDKTKPLSPLLYRKKDNFGDVFARLLQESGIEINGTIRKGRKSATADCWLARTHNIDQILRPMLKKSDNLCAESVFYQLAALSQHSYATYKDAAAQMEHLIRQLKLNPSDYQIADGSGLSLYNYITPELLVAELRYAYNNEEIFAHLYTALPIMGCDGTLSKRCRNSSAQSKVHAKTGTVEGISSLAGYAMAGNGHQLCFAIINQGVRTTTEGRRFQDKVCKAITRGLGQAQEDPDQMSDPAVEENDRDKAEEEPTTEENNEE